MSVFAGKSPTSYSSYVENYLPPVRSILWGASLEGISLTAAYACMLSFFGNWALTGAEGDLAGVCVFGVTTGDPAAGSVRDVAGEVCALRDVTGVCCAL